MSSIVCARSPVAIGRRVAARTRAIRHGIFRRHRLFDPFGLERLEQLRHRGRGRRREAAVHLDHDLHVGSDRLAHGGDDRDGAAALRRRQLGARVAERIELQRAIARARRRCCASAAIFAGSRSAWYQPFA